MKKYIPILLLALALCAPAKAQNRHSITSFVVFLSGTNQAAPNQVAGQGWLILSGNVLNYTIGDFQGSSVDPTLAGIYGPAHPGENGGLIAYLYGWDLLLPFFYGGELELTTSQIAQLRAGLLYVEVNFPGGNIRGQIIREQEAETETEPSPPSRLARIGKNLYENNQHQPGAQHERLDCVSH